MDIAHGTDQFHIFEMPGPEFRAHGLELAGIEQVQKCRLNDIIKMMCQRQLIAAQLLCFPVESASSHPCAHITGIIPGNVIHNPEDIRFEQLHRNIEILTVLQQQLPVGLMKARIHGNKLQFKVTDPVLLHFLKQLCHQKAVFPPGNRNSDPIPFLHQFIIPYGFIELCPQVFPIFLHDAALDFLQWLPLQKGNSCLTAAPCQVFQFPSPQFSFSQRYCASSRSTILP